MLTESGSGSVPTIGLDAGYLDGLEIVGTLLLDRVGVDGEGQLRVGAVAREARVLQLQPAGRRPGRAAGQRPVTEVAEQRDQHDQQHAGPAGALETTHVRRWNSRSWPTSRSPTRSIAITAPPGTRRRARPMCGGPASGLSYRACQCDVPGMRCAAIVGLHATALVRQ
jgi:hypothetical protein